jgi:hypothetical protein
MKWTVAWRREARDELAALWVDADFRAEMTEAANRIDYLLANNPLGVGESRDRGRHVLIEAPLAVIFKVKPAENKVVVTRVWRTT